MKPILILMLLTVLASSPWLRAEDWKTSDGKVYINVKVLKVEADAVTILDRDGGALVPLSKLPADLQTRFHYDPVLAANAEKARAQADAQNAAALQAEKAQAQKQQQLATAAAKAQTSAAKSVDSKDNFDLSKSINDQNWGEDDATHHRDLEYPVRHAQ